MSGEALSQPEDRYVVFKKSDLAAYASVSDLEALARVEAAVDAGRLAAGEAPLDGVVVEADWPEYEATWAALQARIEGRTTFRVLPEVLAELSRATEKFPTWPNDPLHAVAILGEEFGELTRAAMQAVYEPHKGGREQVREEAVQTAAMALRFLLSLSAYDYLPVAQHEQRRLPLRAAPLGEPHGRWRVLAPAAQPAPEPRAMQPARGAILCDLLLRAVPFLRDEGASYEDDGSNEPLELAREIESVLAELERQPQGNSPSRSDA